MLNLIKNRIKLLYAQLLAMANVATPQGEKIFHYAWKLIGTDASPKDIASDEYGCAESVSTILADLFPPFQVVTGTYTLFMTLKGVPEFVEVSSPLAGDIVISPTGFGGRGGILNGHVGIVGQNRIIMSNNSLTGKWDIHYTLDSWRERYQVLGGYPVKFFRRIL